MKLMKSIKMALGAAVLAVGLALPAQAGNIYLTGHDVDLHGGQNDYFKIIVDYLRAGDEPAASYNIVVLGSGIGSNNLPTLLPGAGYTNVKYLNPETADWSPGGTGANAVFDGTDLIIINSHTSCGGCDLSTAGSNAINAQKTAIGDFFNAGGDIYGNSGATLATYYDFLPSGATATGTSIGSSSGFHATAAGVAIGIKESSPNSMINGFPTHNAFPSFASAFTVFETHDTAGAGSAQEVISIGLRGGTFTDDGIVVDDGGTDDDGTPVIPLPAGSYAGLTVLAAMAGYSVLRRKAQLA